MGDIGELPQAIPADYAASVGLPPDARYYGGARLRPVVPLDAAVGGYLVVGAYPLARFETVVGRRTPHLEHPTESHLPQ